MALPEVRGPGARGIAQLAARVEEHLVGGVDGGVDAVQQVHRGSVGRTSAARCRTRLASVSDGTDAGLAFGFPPSRPVSLGGTFDRRAARGPFLSYPGDRT
jgi:hypothetical protein